MVGAVDCCGCFGSNVRDGSSFLLEDGMVNGLKVRGLRIMSVGLVALLPCGVMAQDFGGALIGGMAQQGADRAQEFRRNAPGMIEDMLVPVSRRSKASRDVSHNCSCR